MPAERYFLDWDVPLATRVREFLLPVPPSGLVDLGETLVVVPTRQAGRRLREALAAYCSEWGTALLSPQVVTPAFFLRAAEGNSAVASGMQVSAVWAEVLLRADLTNMKGLFPMSVPQQDFDWALCTAEMIQKVREELLEGGYHVADVTKKFGDILQESERWQDLAALEELYLARLGELGLADPCISVLKQAEAPALFSEVKRVVVAAVPDPAPLVVQILERLSAQVPVGILVQAPPSLSGLFDDWGRPLEEEWRTRSLDIPDDRENIFLAASPLAQGHRVLNVIAEEAVFFGPADIAVGVPDRGVIPFLADALAEEDISPFDPTGRTLAEHPLYQLLEAFCGLVEKGDYATCSAFLRHADVLTFLEKKRGVSAWKLLDELDDFQNFYLPARLGDMVQPLSSQDRGAKACRKGGIVNLARAVAFMEEQVNMFNKSDEGSDALRSFLESVYEVRMLVSHLAEDREFMAAAEIVDSALQEMSGCFIGLSDMDKKHALAIFLRELRKKRYYLEKEGAAIDMEGWLELPWNDAPLLIVTGMNDGSVPDGKLSDSFLPDSLRRHLNLRHDAGRLARDAYLMRVLVEPRRERGRVCFVVGKMDAQGNPLKPSRLLFRCGDEELPARARLLFGVPREERDNYPPAVSFPLTGIPLDGTLPSQLVPTSLPVTALGGYLECPFRFYLRYVLGMEEKNDEKWEMDARDFGSLVHDVLAQMGRDEQMRRCEEGQRLEEFFDNAVDVWAEKRFGSSLPLQVGMQLDAAKQRLGAVAEVQAGLVREGWEIFKSEMWVEGKIEGMRIRGRVDRIDRHKRTGQIRVLDYKTSDWAINPIAAHSASLAGAGEVRNYAQVVIAGDKKRWIDLQLPLYRLMLPDTGEFSGTVELGYFNVPGAVNDTGVQIWEGFDDVLLQSAGECASGVVGDIQCCRFWPPAEKVKFDNFEKLFPRGISQCLDGDSFQSFMARKSSE